MADSIVMSLQLPAVESERQTLQELLTGMPKTALISPRPVPAASCAA